MTEAGPLDLLSGDENEDSDDQGRDIKLPGVRKGEFFTPLNVENVLL